MKTQLVYLIVVGLVIALALGACGGKDPVTPGGGGGPTTKTLSFEDLTIDQQINVGSQYTSDGVNVVVEQFQWSNMTWYTGGWARVQLTPAVGGSGQNIWTNNVQLNFGMPSGVTQIVFKCIDTGGNCNMTINTSFRNVEDLITLNGQTIDGVTVTVAGGTRTPQTITLAGAITAFKVGGQEFAIDDFAYTYTP
jgi:hypothetical protein